jgi:hypothetical protein
MALVLDLEYSQSNDATTLTLTDTAGTYVVTDNEDGWGTPNEETTDIVISTDIINAGSETHLLLDATVTDKNGVEIIYDQINLYDQNGGGFADASELTWDLTSVDFVVSGLAMGEATDKLDDGVYALIYQLVDNDDHSNVIATFSEDIIVDGDVRIDVYNKLRQIPVSYDYEAVDTSREVMEALLAYSYLQAVEASASVAMTEELINMLYTVDKLVSDGSHYTW